MNTSNSSGRPVSSPARYGRDGVTVIIPNLNGREHLPRCLESLRSTTGVDFEVMVADNGSTDGGVEWIRKHHPEVEVLDLGGNRGFSGALMTGVRRSSRPLVCFLNNDTEVRPDWLLHLVRARQSDETIAAVSATLLYMHNPEIINFGGGEMTGPGYGYQGELGRPAASLRDRPEVEDTLFASGAAMLVDRRILLECGGLDEKLYPIYHEDVDLGWRLWLLGYRVVISRKSLVLHHEGGGPGPRPGAERIAMLGLRHSMRCSIKNYELKRLFPALGALMASQVLLGLAALADPAGPGNPAARPPWGLLPRLARITMAGFRVIASALAWNTGRLGDTLRQRRFIQARRRRTDRDLFQRRLIRPRPWFPFQAVPPLDWTLSTDRLFVERKLFPAEDSAIGRLAEGWGPVFGKTGIRSRSLTYLARGRLRVAPGSVGQLEVRVGLTDPADRGAVRVICNREVSRWTNLENREPVTVRCPARPDSRGALRIEIVADAASYSSRRRKWWCAVGKIEFLPEGTGPAPDVRIDVSVIIPTYNRCSHLRDCLSALSRQTSGPREVIVIDDGSTDGTPRLLAELAAGKSLPFALKTVRQENSGPAAARNRGLELAAGNLIAFLGDDMIPEPGWLEKHISAHRQRGLSCAVCGFTDWDREGMPVSPLLEYINLHGHQFGFKHFRPGQEVPFTGFYTSNLTVPARFLEEVRFDEWFRRAAFEDCELGYRLCYRGMRIIYEPGCLVRHRHRMTAGDFCLRQQRLGELWVEMVARWPQLKPYFPFPDPGRVRPPRLEERCLKPAEGLLRRLDRRGIRLPQIIYRLWLHCHFMAGVRAAYLRRDGGGLPGS